MDLTVCVCGVCGVCVGVYVCGECVCVGGVVIVLTVVEAVLALVQCQTLYSSQHNNKDRTYT